MLREKLPHVFWNLAVRIALLLSFTAGLVSCQPIRKSSKFAPGWKYADLRLIDPVDSPTPDSDIIAVYTRRIDTTIQIRLDLLDLTLDSDTNLILALDHQHGGRTDLPDGGSTSIEWDTLIQIPPEGDMQARNTSGEDVLGLKLRIFRNPSLDTLVISFAGNALSPGLRYFNFQIVTYQGSSLLPADSILAASSDGAPPSPVPVLIAFWNTFPAVSPSQALRRWDGAHTGPNSERHGLQPLIEAVRFTGVPVFLLDLKTPASLSALDFVDVLPSIRSLAAEGTLVLPDVQPYPLGRGDPVEPPEQTLEHFKQLSQEAARDFRLRSSPFLYTPGLPSQSDGSYPVIFAGSHLEAMVESNNTVTLGLTGIVRWYSSALVPLPADPASTNWLQTVRSGSEVPDPYASQSVTKNGLSAPLIKMLLEAALLIGKGPVNMTAGSALLLGGDFRQSPWGIPGAAIEALNYISSHPWIRPVGAYDLLSIAESGLPSASVNYEGQPSTLAFSGLPSPVSLVSAGLSPEPFIPYSPAGTPITSGLSVAAIQNELLRRMGNMTSTPIVELAWQSYLALVTPTTPETPALTPLRAGYLSTLGHLVAAGEWAATPASFDAEAQVYPADLDWDGEDEYVLSSDSWFAVFEVDGAYLTYAFARMADGVHLVAAPSSLFFIGLSDPSEWDYTRGVAGDPGQLRGAFTDFKNNKTRPGWERYTVETGDGRLSFSSPDGSIHKEFELTGSGLRARYFTTQPVSIWVPLAPDPWRRFSPGWSLGDFDEPISGGWMWHHPGGPGIKLTTNAELSIQAYAASRSLMGAPENPDAAIPPGHYLPFPMSLGIIQGEGNLEILLEVVPSEEK